MKGPLDIWRRFSVSTRIAAAIIAALVSVQAFAILQFMMSPEPKWSVFGLRWLAEASSEATQAAFEQPPERRNAVLRELGASRWLTITWQAQAPPGPPPHHPSEPFGDRIEATLRDRLRARAKDVHVTPAPGLPPLPRSLAFVPADLQAALPKGALRDDEPEIVVPGRFRIHIQGPDDSWISLSPRGDRGGAGHYWPFLPLIGGTLVVVLLSLLTARRILAPLDQLTRAAQRLGVEREPAPIVSQGLGEFASIAEALNHMQARLKRFVDERTQMLAAMSHDLRTSLTRLRLEAENLADDEPRSALTREIEEMEAMISATIAFAGGDARGEPSRAIDLAALLISLCDGISDRGAVAVYHGPEHARLCCQPVTIKRALTNVLDNAVKYGGNVEVMLRVTPQAAVVRISDDGPGIPADRRQEAFAPFRRLETSRNRETGGVGLGLTIARDAIRAHGGAIELGNGNPRGLVVTITLPLQEPAPATA